jgi:hypothetical protein
MDTSKSTIVVASGQRDSLIQLARESRQKG